jgi:DNA-binding SARP family transcriptional activator
LEALAQLAIRRGHYGRAIDIALSAIQADPLRESAHRVLIRAHAAEGNSGAAMLQYREFCRLAHETLDIGPSRELRDLVAGVQASR